MNPIRVEVVRKVNSKLFSLELERELGIALPGTTVVSSLEELFAALREHFSDEKKNKSSNTRWAWLPIIGFSVVDPE